MRILAIQRDLCFSPHSEFKDNAILMAVVQRLIDKDHVVDVFSECELPVCEVYDMIFSMGRHHHTLQWLISQKVPVLNAPQAVLSCSRRELQKIMQVLSIPQPPSQGTHGYWLKRCDTARSADDVVFVDSVSKLNEQITVFRKRGITDYTVSAHVIGDVVKFYGVCPKDTASSMSFFRFFYPTDDDDTKYGDENHNGPAHHYSFCVSELQDAVELLAKAIGINVYGGDCIIREDGTFCIIDFNDWPSFSRCRDEAASAIVNLIENGNF